MNKPVFYIVLLFSFFGNAQQNLAPDPSFEDYHGCPFYEASLDSLSYWFRANKATTDYMNVCSADSYTSVPQNIFGYQMPRTGSGYVHSMNEGTASEYFECRLIEPLEANVLYEISIYICLTETSRYWVEKLGCRITKEVFMLPTIQRDENVAETYFNGVKTDTLNWQKLTAYYLAKGQEEYVTIGMFDNGDYPDTTWIEPSQVNPLFPDGFFGDYYWDDVSIVACNECMSAFSVPNIVTANGDHINDQVQLEFPIDCSFVIMNRWGNVVYQSEDEVYWPEPDSDLVEGTYFYRLSFELSGVEQTKTGFIQLVR